MASASSCSAAASVRSLLAGRCQARRSPVRSGFSYPATTRVHQKSAVRVVGSVPARGPAPLRASETSKEATERRQRESDRIEERTQYVANLQELDAFLSEAEDKLVFLSIEKTDVCDLSDYPEETDIQRSVSDDAMAPCTRVKHTLARIARECTDAVFLTLEVDEDDHATVELAKELGVSRYPTYQYYKNSEKVWEHTGAGRFTKQSIGEGMLFYGGQAQGGESVDNFITQVHTRQDLDDFLEMCAAPQQNARGVELDVACDKQLAVLNVSQNKDSPGCLHIYPAVLALAKNTAGACRWARVLSDSTVKEADLVDHLNIKQVPTFIFYNDKKEVGRYVGSDRLELMNTVIKIQQQQGFKLPESKPRKRIPIAEAKRIAQEARSRQKAQQWTQ